MRLLHKRTTWTKEEDEALLNIIRQNTHVKWKQVHQEINSILPLFNKTTKQCRERWTGILNPNILRTKWSEQELDTLFETLRNYGFKWSLVRQKLIGRTDHSIKNIFYCRIRKMIRRMAKSQVEEDMYENTKEFERCLFVLLYIRDNYINPQRDIMKVSGDQYIVSFVLKNQITDAVFYKFTCKMMMRLPLWMKVKALLNYESIFNITYAEEQPIIKKDSSCMLIREPISIYHKMAFTFEPYMNQYH